MGNAGSNVDFVQLLHDFPFDYLNISSAPHLCLDECVYLWLMQSYRENAVACASWAVAVSSPFEKSLEFLAYFKNELVRLTGSESSERIGSVLLLYIHFSALCKYAIDDETLGHIFQFLLIIASNIHVIQDAKAFSLLESILENLQLHGKSVRMMGLSPGKSFWLNLSLLLEQHPSKTCVLKVLVLFLKNLKFEADFADCFGNILLQQDDPTSWPIVDVLNVYAAIYQGETINENFIASFYYQWVLKFKMDENIIESWYFFMQSFNFLESTFSSTLLLQQLLDLQSVSISYWNSNPALLTLHMKLLENFSHLSVASQFDLSARPIIIALIQGLWTYMVNVDNPNRQLQLARSFLSMKYSGTSLHSSLASNMSSNCSLGTLFWRALIQQYPILASVRDARSFVTLVATKLKSVT